MTDSNWTNEEEEAFNEVEKNSNLGKQILQAQGQPYHWEADAIKAAVLIEREACVRICESTNILLEWPTYADAIRARGNVATNDTSSERVDINGERKHDTPPQRTWVGLTDEEIMQVMEIGLGVRDSIETALDKLKEKNNV
jgi:hypothetical protein